MDTYTYYPDNMRKSKDRNGSMTQIWMNDEIALDTRGDAVQSSYIHGNKLISSAYGWYLYNAHGDVTALTDDVGEVTYNYKYDPYGVEISEPGASESMNPYRYCGEYFDEETGFTYLRAGYYDAKIGWFISEDPALDGLNWYAYCGNDPVNGIDPSGEMAIDPATIDKVIGVIGGIAATVWVVGSGVAKDLYNGAKTVAKTTINGAKTVIKVGWNKITGQRTYYTVSSKSIPKPRPAPKPKSVSKSKSVSKPKPRPAPKPKSNSKRTSGANKNNKKPKNPQKANDKQLKKNGHDAHEIKSEYLGKKAPISRYDLYVDKTTGRIWIYSKGGKGIPMPTDYFMK